MSVDDKTARELNIGKSFETGANVGILDKIHSSYLTDNLTSINGLYRTLSNKIYKDNSINKVRKYYGQVLRVDKMLAGDANAKNTFDLQFTKELSPDTPIITYKVRIPALDGLITRKIPLDPTNPKYNKVLDLYDNYTSDYGEEFNVGDYVEVVFDNYFTLTGGKILPTGGRLILNQAVEAGNAYQTEGGGIPIGLEGESTALTNKFSSVIIEGLKGRVKGVVRMGRFVGEETVYYPSRPGSREDDDRVFRAILKGISAPINVENIKFMRAWTTAEHGYARAAIYNAFNSTQKMPGASAFNSVAVRNYVSEEQGIKGNVVTLLNGFYPLLLNSLRAGTYSASQIAENNFDNISTWGTAHTNKQGQKFNGILNVLKLGTQDSGRIARPAK